MATAATLMESPVLLAGPPISRRRFTVDEYHRMAEVGILSEDDRVELIDGEVLVMCPVGSPHAGCVKRVGSLLNERLQRRAIVSVQDPLRIDDHMEPLPDLMLLRPRRDFYSESHPAPADVLLLIEVMDTSADYDRNVKLPLYARSAIPEVWLIDLNLKLVESHRRPLGEIYSENRILPRGQRLSPEALPDLEVAVDDILG
jgi:Uma2 family endonuclease